jgi:predicted Fe-S protein YdhL (DUF1289 family)
MSESTQRPLTVIVDPLTGDELIPSPCVSICALDEADVCIGCFRSGSEITDWFMASSLEKRAILARANERRLAQGGNGLS